MESKETRETKRKTPRDSVEAPLKLRRCSSPSHFRADDISLFEPPHLARAHLPERMKLNHVLEAVENCFYHQAASMPQAISPATISSSNHIAQESSITSPTSTSPTLAVPAISNPVQTLPLKSRYGFWALPDESTREMSYAPNALRYHTLDMLMSPLRKPDVWESWTLKEIAVFEAAICNFGKDFHAIQKVIKTKTSCEIVDFYYQWKKSNHCMMWKAHGRPVAPVETENEQAAAVAQLKMKAFAPVSISSGSSSS